MRLTFLFILVYSYGFSQSNDSLLYQLQQIPNDTERVNQIYNSGFELRNSNPELSYSYAIACEKEALKSKSSKHLAKSYNLLGVLFYKKGDYQQALQYQNKALSINTKINYNLGIAINQTNLGNIYTELNYLNQAEGCYLQALKTYNLLQNKLQITRCLINIGTLKSTKKQFDLAIKHYREALVYANEIGDLELISDCNNNIGDNLINLNQLDSASIYLEEGLKLRDLIDNEYEKANSYNNLARLYLKKEKLIDALNCIKLAESNATLSENTEALVETYAMYALYYEKNNQFKEALGFTKKQVALKDSLINLEKENKSFFTLKEENSSNNENNHSIIIWLYVIIGILSSIIIFIFLKKKS